MSPHIENKTGRFVNKEIKSIGNRLAALSEGGKPLENKFIALFPKL